MQTKSITSVTYILIGNLLLVDQNFGSGWAATLVAILGIILIFTGLSNLKKMLDKKGQNGVLILIISLSLQLLGAFFSLIPLVGFVPETIFNFIGFVLEFVGLFIMLSSITLGKRGKAGFVKLLIAISLLTLGTIIGWIPIIGGTFKSIFAVASLILLLFGWLEVQTAVIERENTTANQS